MFVSFEVYRAQNNSPVPSNVPPSTLNKSPHGTNTGGLYPPTNPSSTNTSVPPSVQQQQRSPAGSVPSPSPSGPITSSISPQNPAMNKAPTPQPPPMSQQQRPYLPPQQGQGRVINGTGMDPTTSSSYIQGQQPYMPQQGSYPMQQNGYGHHPNGTMPQQHYSMYHQQQQQQRKTSETFFVPIRIKFVLSSASTMSVPPNQIAKPNSPSNTQQQSILPPSSSPKPSSSSSPSQPTNTHNLVSNQQPPMPYNNYSGQPMYHPQQNYHMQQQQQQQQWQNQPRMMMQPQYTPYSQGQYQPTPPPT